MNRVKKKKKKKTSSQLFKTETQLGSCPLLRLKSHCSCPAILESRVSASATFRGAVGLILIAHWSTVDSIVRPIKLELVLMKYCVRIWG